jgi:hypothetical protein
VSREEEFKVYLEILGQCLKVLKKLDKTCRKKGMAIRWIALTKHDPYKPMPPKDPLRIILDMILDIPPEWREPERKVTFTLDVSIKGRETPFSIILAELTYTGTKITGDIYTAKDISRHLSLICGD